MLRSAWQTPSRVSAFAAQTFTSPREAMETVVRLLAEQLSVHSTFVSHISAETRKFEVVAAFNAPGGCDIREGTVLPLPETFCCTIASASELMPVAVPDARSDPHFGTLPSHALFRIGSNL